MSFADDDEFEGSKQQAVGMFLLGSLTKSSRFAISKVLSTVLLQSKWYFRTHVWKEMKTTI